MSRKARTRAAAAAVLLLVAGGALAFGQVSGTFAIFTSETVNQNAVAQGSCIPAPTVSSSAVGGTGQSQAVLTWVSGASAGSPSPNPVTGQTLLYADGGSGASASCGSYSSFKSEGAGTTTDTVTGTNFTNWWCFEIQSTSASASTSGSWTSSASAFTAVRLFVPTAVTLSNTGTHAGQIEQGDTIAIDFNQAPSAPGGTFTVAASNSAGTITIGSIGTISGLTITASRSYTASTATVSGNTLTVAVNGGNGASGKPTPVTGLPGTFTGTGTYTSSGGQSVCTAAACTVLTSGGF